MKKIQQLLRAAVFAADKHRDQRRKDDTQTPYINHPLRVAEILVECGVEEVSVLLAAILHDTVEDTETTFEELEAHFGLEVCQLVAEVTDDKSLPKQQRKSLQIENAPKKSRLAKQLKIADKTCNVSDLSLTSPVQWDVERKEAYLNWAEQVVAGCLGVNDQLDQRFAAALEMTREELGRSQKTRAEEAMENPE